MVFFVVGVSDIAIYKRPYILLKVIDVPVSTPVLFPGIFEHFLQIFIHAKLKGSLYLESGCLLGNIIREM
jgi:hypothetical protein